jgi:hypothetical protein
MVKKESIVYGTILKLLEETLKEVLPPLKETLKGPKRIRNRLLFYKYNECTVSICRPEKSY